MGLNEDSCNINDLSNEDWRTLITNLFYYVIGTSTPAISAGICSLKYMHDISPHRFDKSIVSIILEANNINLNDSWDYNNLYMMMQVCNCSTINDFLCIGVNSSDVDVSESAKGYLIENQKDSIWYEYYLNEYKKRISNM